MAHDLQPLSDNQLLGLYRKIKQLHQSKKPSTFKIKKSAPNLPIFAHNPSIFKEYQAMRNGFLRHNSSSEEIKELERFLINHVFKFDDGSARSFFDNLQVESHRITYHTDPLRWKSHSRGYETALTILPLLGGSALLGAFIFVALALMFLFFGLIFLATPAGIPMLITASVATALTIICAASIVVTLITAGIVDHFHKKFEMSHSDKLDIDHPNLFSLTEGEISLLANNNINPLKARVALIICREELEKTGWPHSLPTQLFNKTRHQHAKGILDIVAEIKAGALNHKEGMIDFGNGISFSLSDTPFEPEHNIIIV